MRHAVYRATLSALHLRDIAYAEAGGLEPNGGGKAGDDVVETTYPDSLTVAGGKGTDTLVLHWAADANNVTVDLAANAKTGGYDGTVTDGAGSATVKFTSFERFDITSGSGADALYGGSGDDNLDGGSGADLMNGGAGNDTYHLDNVNDVLIESADGGTDTIVSTLNYTLNTNFENLAFVGPGRHTGVGNAVDNRLTASDAGDSLSGLDGSDTLIGGAGADTLVGGRGGDSLAGGGGNDVYYIQADANGQPLLDVVTEAADGGIDTIHLGTGNLTYALPDNVENLDTIYKRDLIVGNDLDNKLTGRPGGGDETLVGGAGNDTLESGSVLVGGAGDDTYVTTHDFQTITEQAGGGVDTVQSYGNLNGLPDNVENLVLLQYSLFGYGNALNNVITGDDRDNILEGLEGGDTLIGGAGLDTASYQHAASAVIVDLSIEGAQRTRGAGADTLQSMEGLEGSKYDDKLSGDANNNVLTGGDGADTLAGRDGADSLDGQAGSDTLDGGHGADQLTGGGGDTFLYTSVQDSTATAADTLTLGSTDVIDVSAIDADTTQAGDQAFHRVAALDGHAGELILVADGSSRTLLEADVDGDGQADLYAVITGAHADFNNFVL